VSRNDEHGAPTGGGVKAVILAAGKGSRFGELSQRTPKCLFQVAGKPILSHVLEALPGEISEIIVVIAHLGDEIKRVMGNEHRGCPIRYCLMAPLTGTAGALWSAREFLPDRFLAVNGDDIIGADDIRHLVAHEYAWGYSERPSPKGGYWDMTLDRDGFISGYIQARPSNKARAACRLSTGSYALTPAIFEHELVRMKNGEYGLPHTLVRLTNRIKFKGVRIDRWIPVNTPEELDIANRALEA
jgi:NDP-sugar pyrophosphorylase family protein